MKNLSVVLGLLIFFAMTSAGAYASSVSFGYGDAKIEGAPSSKATVDAMKARCTQWCSALKDTNARGIQRCEGCCYGGWNLKSPGALKVSYDPGPGCKKEKVAQ